MAGMVRHVFSLLSGHPDAMGLLDKLKPQPRWKHADVAVRLEAVRELEDQIELAALAETDADLKVRRAAVAKLTDPAALGRVVAAESDAEARDRAADRLAAFATSPETDEATALLASRALTDPRRLSAIAKGDAAGVRPDGCALAADRRTRVQCRRPAGEARGHRACRARPRHLARGARRHRRTFRSQGRRDRRLRARDRQWRGSRAVQGHRIPRAAESRQQARPHADSANRRSGCRAPCRRGRARSAAGRGARCRRASA